MSYLPTGPLIPYLEAQIDTDLLGQGGFKSGIDGVMFELQRITGHRIRSEERQLVRILRGEVKQIKEVTADRIAAALGLHPRDIWNDWYEKTSEPADLVWEGGSSWGVAALRLARWTGASAAGGLTCRQLAAGA